MSKQSRSFFDDEGAAVIEVFSLHCKVVKGKASFYAELPLRSVYRQMFRRACRGIVKHPKKVEPRIVAIVFGCFWLEAYTSEVLRRALVDDLTHEELANQLWEQLKGTHISNKLQLISSALHDDQHRITKEQIKKTVLVFDVRNRLSHYKGERQQFGDVVDIEYFRDNVRAVLDSFELPVVDILEHLISPKMDEYCSIVNDTGKWLRNANYQLADQRDMQVSPMKTFIVEAPSIESTESLH